MFKFGYNAGKVTRNINRAFGERRTDERTTWRSFEKFQSRDMSLENEPRGRREAAI